MNRKKPVQSIMHTQGPKKGCSKLLGLIYMIMFCLVPCPSVYGFTFCKQTFFFHKYWYRTQYPDLEYPILASHCPKMEMNEEKPSKFQFHFPVLRVPCPMKKKLSEEKLLPLDFGDNQICPF